MKSTRFATLCVALGLVSFSILNSHAQITIDGTRDAGYNARAAIQTTPSSWGGGNTLASLSFKQDGATLNVFLAGRADGNCVYLFVDSKSGGANKLVNNLIIAGTSGDEWRLNNFGTSATAGMTFESGFEADYAIGIEPGGWTHLFPIDLTTPQSRQFIGNCLNTNNAAGGPVALLKADPSINVANASTHVNGFEFALNLSSLGVPSGATNYPIKFMALIINGGVNYMGNQTLGSLPGTQTTDVGGWGNFQALNFEALSGVQTVTINVDNADFDGDGIADGTDTDDDNDGLLDAVETGTGIWVSSSDTGTNPKSVDTDGDGLNDGVETNTGTYVGVTDTGSNPLVADDYDRDMLPDFHDTDDDNDTLADTVETNTNTWVSSSNTGTNPKNADTDGDGLRDNVETNTGSYASAADTGTSPLLADQARVFLVGNNVLFPSGEWLVDNTNNLLAPVVGGPFSAKTVTKPIAAPGFIEFKFSAGNWNTNWGKASNTVITLNTNNGTISATLIQDKVPTTNDVTENLRIHRAKGEYVFALNDAPNSLQFSVTRKTYATLTEYTSAYGLTGYDADPAEDPDADNLTTQQEFDANTAPNLADTDGDGLTDAEEISGIRATPPLPTNPLLNDTDGDGLLDLWELTNQINPTVATGSDGANGDPDNDGANNLLEQTNGTNPNSANSGFSSPYGSARLFGDFNGWSGNPSWQNAMRLTANNTWEAMIYVTSTNLSATNGFKVITVQQGTNTAYWGRSGGVGSTLAVKNAAENLLTTNIVSGTNYYHFTFNDFSGAVTVTRVIPDVDSDGDLLPDAWEQYYGRFVNPALTNSPWLLVGTNYNSTADISDNGTRTNLTTGQKYQRGFNPVEDVIPPVIVWNEPLTLFVESGMDYADAATGTDNNLTAPIFSHSLTNIPAGSPDGVFTNVVTLTDAASNSVTGNRKLVLGGLLGGYGPATFYNLQYPRLATNATTAGSFDAYAQVWVDGVTGGTNVDTRIRCWIGVASTDADPTVNPEAFSWVPAAVNAGYADGNDEYKATFTNLAVGTNYVASRWSIGTNPAGPFYYGGINEDSQGGRWGLQTTADVGGVTVPRTYSNGQIVVQGVPTITWANLQFPTIATNEVGASFDVYGRFFAQDVTGGAGAPTYGTVVAQFGYHSANTDPSGWPNLNWATASWVAQAGNNDEYKATLSGLSAGTYYTATRFSLDAGITWIYGGTNGVWNNDSGTITVNPAAPTGSTFAGWSSGGATNSELVGKYGIGGATNLSAASEKPVSAVDSNTLSLSAIVRTNDTNLTVVGEAGGSLTNWSTNGVSVTASTNTNGVPEGHERRVFSVDRTNSPTRQFLRLKATLAP
jgi:hypothetical protein